jgi:Mg-chelatase subunit ChlD
MCELSIFHAPSRTSQQTVEDIVRYVGKYYDLPLSVRFDERIRTAAVDMRQNLMLLNPLLTKAKSPKIIFYTGHECAHVRIFPRTAHEQLYYEAWARQLGIRCARRFLNRVADQLVNDHCLTEPPFKEEFTKGCESFYRIALSKVKRHGTSGDLWHFGNSYRRVLEVREKKVPPFRNQAEEELFKLVFHDMQPFDKRFPRIVELARELLQDEEDERLTDETMLPPIVTPKEYEEWMKKIGRLRKDAVLQSLRNYSSRRILMDYVTLKAFDEYIIAQSNMEKRARQRSGRGDTLDVWHPADRVGDLEIQRTLQSYGVFIPSVTALKRVSGVEEEEKRHGCGLQAHVLDCSGSMIESIDLVAMICFASIKHAEYRGDEIALLSFSNEDSPMFHLKPTRNYSAARPVLQEIQAEGGTYMAPALRWLADYCQHRRLKPTVIIYSDTMIADPNDSVVELRRLAATGGGIILVNTIQYDSRWVQEAMSGLRMHQFRVDYENLANIQSILRYVMS